jgi:hypothetical protein
LDNKPSNHTVYDRTSIWQWLRIDMRD